MPSNIITLQVGQCGNQLGMEYWRRMCMEHGIGPRGELSETEVTPGDDRKDIFFNEANYGRKYVPRAVLVDLEPRVLNEITSEENSYFELFNPQNIFQDPTGGGAGNNWGRGYNQTEEIIEQIFEIISSEAERVACLEGLAMVHSIMGGTGSGLGSRLLKEFHDRFPKTIVHTYTVMSPLFPDVNVAPYNVIPSLDSIADYTDFTILFDNDAFHKFSKDGNALRSRFRGSQDELNLEKKNYAQINSMMSQIMTSLSAPLRYYSPIYSRLMHIAGILNPLPPMQFIQPAFTPFTSLNPGNVANRPIVFQDTKPILSHITNPNQLITSTNELLKKMSDEEVVRRERQHQQAITTVPRSSSEVNLNQTPQQMQPVGGQLRQRAPSTRSVYGGGGGGSEKGVGVVGSGGGKESPFGGADDFKFTPPAMKPQKIDSANYCLISGLGIIQLENNKNGAENGGHRLGSEITTIAAAGASKRSKAPEYISPPWMGGTSMELTKTHLSPYMDHSMHPATGLLLANHTSVSVAFQRMLQKYSEQRRGGAFLNGYKTEGVVEQMDDSREHIENIVRLYKEVNTAEFPNL